MPVYDLGAIGIVFKGEYVPSITYNKLNTVRGSTDVYISLIDSNNQPLEDESAWALFIKDGDVPSEDILELIAADTRLIEKHLNDATKLDNTAIPIKVNVVEQANTAFLGALQGTNTDGDTFYYYFNPANPSQDFWVNVDGTKYYTKPIGFQLNKVPTSNLPAIDNAIYLLTGSPVIAKPVGQTTTIWVEVKNNGTDNCPMSDIILRTINSASDLRQISLNRNPISYGGKANESYFFSPSQVGSQKYFTGLPGETFYSGQSIYVAIDILDNNPVAGTTNFPFVVQVVPNEEVTINNTFTLKYIRES